MRNEGREIRGSQVLVGFDDPDKKFMLDKGNQRRDMKKRGITWSEQQQK